MKYKKDILSEIENLKYCYKNCDTEDIFCHIYNIYDYLSDSYNIPRVKRVTYLHRNTLKAAGMYTFGYNWVELIDPYYYSVNFTFSLWFNVVLHEWIHHYDFYQRPERKDNHDAKFYEELSYLNVVFHNKKIKAEKSDFTYDLLELRLKHKTSHNTKIYKICDSIIDIQHLRKAKKSYVKY